MDFTLSPALQYTIWKALRFHRKMEKEFLNRVRGIAKNSVEFELPNLRLNLFEYFSKNVFSIFFISILDQLQIETSRKKIYSMITHLIRGIVTAADNMIDDEKKGAIIIKGINGRILPNVILTLVQNGILNEFISDLSQDRSVVSKVYTEILSALIEIGLEESSEESRIEEVLSPEELLNSIHHYRGGKLLSLPFVVPLLLEKHCFVQLDAYRTAMYKIGMAVQMLDDVTDFSLDIKERNHNLLRSLIVHGRRNLLYDHELLSMVETGCIEPEIAFPEETREVVQMAIDSAISGFDLMAENGYPINRTNTRKILKMLFNARNVSNLWRLVDPEKSRKVIQV